MDNTTFDNISIIKEENIIQNNQKTQNGNKKENNIFNLSKSINQDEFDFEKSFELSNIVQNDNPIKHNINNENSNVDINLSLDCSFINQNINIFNIKKNINENKNNNNIRPVKTMPLKKIKKEDLDNIPIPIFSCIYCSNEYISFKHLSNEIISNKYLLQTSNFDLKQLDYLISFLSKIDRDNINNNKLLNLVLNHSEYLKLYYNIDKSKQYFNLNIFREQCKNNYLKIKTAFKQRFEDNVVRKKKDFYFKGIKGINKISKNSINNKCLFNSSNSLINNYSALNGFIINGTILTQPLVEKINNSNQSNSSLYNNSPALNKNEIGLIGKGNNMHYMENIIEKIDKNNESENILEDKEKILDFFDENDLKRKINKNNIEWEDNYYDIYNPIIDDDILEKSFEKDEYELIKNKKNNHKFKDLFNSLNSIKNNDNVNNKHCYINSENNINTINTISKNDIKSKNKKFAMLNNSKSLASTNTSSNIILKNSVRDKENKPLSIFLNVNKIINIKNNNSTINTSKCNTNIQNKLAYLSSNKIKDEKILKECNRTPSFTKTRIIDLGTKSEKKINNYGKSSIDLKNIHKKILFNYTANVKKEILDNNITLKIRDVINKNNNKTLYSNIYNINNNTKNKDKDREENEMMYKYNKYNLLVTKSNINNDTIYNKTLFNKTAKGFRDDKNNNFNVLFKIKNNFEYCPFKQKIDNKKQSSILDKNNITNNYNIMKNKDNKEYNINLKSLEKDIEQKKNKLNNIRTNHKSAKKENISIPKKVFSENNNLNRIKAKSSMKRGNIILIDVKNKFNN